MNREVNRRQAMIGLAAGAGLLAAGNPALAQGGKYKEAPLLAEQVKAGKLPPVEARLPQNPLVVPVVERSGEYGGVWRRAFLGPADSNNYVRVVFDALFRFSPDGAKIEPKIAEAAEPAGLDQEPRRHRGQGGKGRRQHRSVHLCRSGDAVPDRRRQPGWRRPHL